MFKFLLEMVIVCGSCVILYLFARALPRIEEKSSMFGQKRNRDTLSVYLEKADEWITMIAEKFLRRMKVLVLKLDNFVSVQLNKFKKESIKENGFGDAIEEMKEKEKEED